MVIFFVLCDVEINNMKYSKYCYYFNISIIPEEGLVKGKAPRTKKTAVV